MTKHDKVHIQLLQMWVFSVQAAGHICVFILNWDFFLPVFLM